MAPARLSRLIVMGNVGASMGCEFGSETQRGGRKFTLRAKRVEFWSHPPACRRAENSPRERDESNFGVTRARAVAQISQATSRRWKRIVGVEGDRAFALAQKLTQCNDVCKAVNTHLGCSSTETTNGKKPKKGTGITIMNARKALATITAAGTLALSLTLGSATAANAIDMVPCDHPDYLHIYARLDTTCWANAGKKDVWLYGVTAVRGGNNGGRLHNIHGGLHPFPASNQVVEFPFTMITKVEIF
jgi:hypothetical protein